MRASVRARFAGRVGGLDGRFFAAGLATGLGLAAAFGGAFGVDERFVAGCATTGCATNKPKLNRVTRPTESEPRPDHERTSNGAQHAEMASPPASPSGKTRLGWDAIRKDKLGGDLAAFDDVILGALKAHEPTMSDREAAAAVPRESLLWVP